MDLKGFLRGEMPVAPDRGFGALTSWTPKKPVIAAVDGFAYAGGMELALGCDMIVANVNAKFGIPEAKRGLVAAGGGVVQAAAPAAAPAGDGTGADRRSDHRPARL